MVAIAFILLQVSFGWLSSKQNAVVLPQEFAYTAEKVMFMSWLWTVQVVSINRSFYHLPAPRVSLRDQPVL